MKDYNFLENLSYRILPLLITVYTFSMGMFTYYDMPFCSTSGCEAAGEVMNISKVTMYLMGSFAGLVLFILGKKAYKSNKAYLNLMFLGYLFILIITEYVFLSFLVAKTGEFCILCLIFFSLLVLSFVFAVISFSNKELLPVKSFVRDLGVLLLLTSIATTIAFALMDFSGSSSSVNLKNENFKYALIGSEDCKYCKKVKAMLKKENIEYLSLDIKDYKNLIPLFGGKTIPVLIEKKGNNFSVFNNFNSIVSKIENLNKKSSPLVQDLDGTSSANIPSFLLPNSLDLNEEEGCSITTECED